MLYAGQSAQGSVTFFSDLEQLCVRMWTPWFIAWLLQCVSTYRQRLWSQNTSPPLCHTYQLHPPWHTLNGGHWAHGHMGTTGILTSSTVLRIEQTQCQIVSTVSRKHHHGSWNWLSCQTHRTPVILVTTWLLRQLYNYEGVSNAVNCIADFGCKRLFKLIKLPQTLCCFHPGWDGYDHIRQWWWKRLASPSGWSWAKHYHTIAIIFKHLLIVPWFRLPLKVAGWMWHM